MQKKSLLILLIIFLNLLSSCATVPDVLGCVEISINKGYCTYTISDRAFYIDDVNKYQGKTWFDIRNEMLLIPSDSWAKIKAFIIKTCKNNKCEKDIAEINSKINNIDKIIERDF